jgi:hypothetical protein
VGITLVPLDSAEAWVLSDWPISRIAFYPLLSKHMSDEKRERQIPSSGRLATWWCTPSQNLYIYLQMISGIEQQKPLWNEYKALRKMSRLYVLCPNGHTFFCSTTSTNQSWGGIFALLAAFLCLSAYCPSHILETMSFKVSMGGGGQSIHGSSALGGSWGHFKTVAMLAIVTSKSLSSMEETRTSGRL